MLRRALAAKMAALATLVAASLPVPAFAAPALHPGSTGPAVLQLQIALYDAGADLPLTADLEQPTENADASLGIDPHATLRLGDSGPAVTALQHALSQAGYPVKATGRFGPFTQSLVRHFQQDRGQNPNGVIDLTAVESATALYTVMGDLDGVVGDAYTWGGSSPGSGFDCSGLVRYIYSQVGIDLAHSSYAQWDAGAPVSSGELQPGDLVFFSAWGDGPSHVGIYIGDNRFIHAENPAQGVTVTSLDAPYWFNRFVGARRIL